MPKDKTDNVSLHDQIRDDIRRKVLKNAWQPGYRIPYEHELMIQYGCSRMTVSKAVASLVNAGLLERRRRAGTFVVYPSTHRASIIIPDIRKAILEAGFSYSYGALQVERRSVTNEEKEIFKRAADTEVIEIRSVHFADQRPFAFESRRINLATTPDAAAADFISTPPSIWLLTHVPWNNAEHQIETIALPAEVAGVLAVEPGTPALRLERRTWNEGGVITHAHQYFPEGKLKLHASFLMKSNS
jgi:GntR family histidine utilization transcriptional repressor